MDTEYILRSLSSLISRRPACKYIHNPFAIQAFLRKEGVSVLPAHN